MSCALRESTRRVGFYESRPLVKCYLAVAQVVCPYSNFLPFARRVLRDTKFPILPLCPTQECGPQETERWFRTRLARVLREFVRRKGVDLENLLAPPQPEGEDARSYCPRCEAQYTLSEGECFACGGIPLQCFERDKSDGRGLHPETR